MARAKLIRLIQVGARELGMDKDTRHALQMRETGVGSLTDMTEAQMRQVVKALEALGFKPKGTAKKPASRGDLRFVHVLWRKLGEAGELKRPDRAGLNAFIRSRFGDTWESVPIDVDALRDPRQIAAVVQALKAWCRRAGIQTERAKS